MREKNIVMSSAGLGTKNDCTGEAQQQITRLTDVSHHTVESNEAFGSIFGESNSIRLVCQQPTFVILRSKILYQEEDERADVELDLYPRRARFEFLTPPP
jgi:hypothetical protein